MQLPVLFTLGLATSFASLSTAHTVFTTLFVNDVNQGDGTCVRMSKQGNVSTHPIASGINSPDMACGRDGQETVAFTCPAPAGSKLTLEFRMWADASKPGSIDPSHVGPMAVYLKRVSNIKTDAAAGPGWFKIWDEGYDAAAKKWATEKLIAQDGLLSIELPSGLPTGYYLARHEIITIQNVTNDKVDPQFYVGCAQLFIQGSSTSESTSIPLDKLVSIPGHVQATDPGLTLNPYKDDLTTYQTVGPSIFFPAPSSNINTNTAGGRGTNAKTQQSTAQTQTDGLIPPTCLLKNANWCAAEVPSYTTEAGCWAAGEDCYAQLDVCYKTAPPTGSKGCRVWEEDKCAVIQAACQSGNFQGPPRKGEKLGAAAGGGGDGVDQPVPGGKVPPAAVNAGAEGQGQQAGSTPTPTKVSTTPTAVSASAAPKKTSKCGGRRRERRQRRRV
ncbi:glycoside hydrolase [Staphylotrichum tortipilum]|uniref:lytic cellulose monooxygenase (C4-dehydrogenating) n=1 Tax=Staphylotrichum tortipilum TaxID=2831512 RepID=A0AAN6MT59_9PEZI|nr:glycoside hydrolase [Staphylotrichum longicolle]